MSSGEHVMIGANRDYELQLPQSFLMDFSTEAQFAQSRVWLQVMDMQPGEASSQVSFVFQQAAVRGLETRLSVDSYSLTSEGRPLFLQIENVGTTVTFLNPPRGIDRFVRVFGRNHIKIAVVDDTAWIGGVNITDDVFRSSDFMIRITDPKIVKELADQFIRGTVGLPNDNTEVTLRDEAIVLVDAGKLGRSGILSRAIELIDGSRHSVKNVSMFLPDGRIRWAMERAYKRGVEVEAVTSDFGENEAKNIFGLLNRLSKKIEGIPQIPLQYYNQWLHAKLLVVDERVALVGSHNLSWKGVVMGTSEIALQSTNPNLIDNLLVYYESLKNDSHA